MIDCEFMYTDATGELITFGVHRLPSVPSKDDYIQAGKYAKEWSEDAKISWEAEIWRVEAVIWNIEIECCYVMVMPGAYKLGEI